MSKKNSKINYLKSDLSKSIHVFFKDYIHAFNKFFSSCSYNNLKEIFNYNELSIFELNRFLALFQNKRFKHYFSLHEIAYYIIQYYNIECDLYAGISHDYLINTFPYPFHVASYISCIYDLFTFNKLSDYIDYIKEVYNFLSSYKFDNSKKLSSIVCYNVFIELNFSDSSIEVIDITDIDLKILESMKKHIK